MAVFPHSFGWWLQCLLSVAYDPDLVAHSRPIWHGVRTAVDGEAVFGFCSPREFFLRLLLLEFLF